MKRDRRSPALLTSGLATTLLASLAASQVDAVRQPTAPVPEPLDRVVFGANKHPHVNVTVSGHDFTAIPSLADTPHLLWNRDANKPLDLAFDRDKTRAWLAAAGATLGHRDFAPRLQRVSSWHGTEVWHYELVRKDVVLLDASVDVYWKKGKLLGIHSKFPLPITAIDEPAAADRGQPNKVYFAEHRTPHAYRLRIATLAREETDTHVVTSVVTARGTAYRISEQKTTAVAPAGAATFTEYQVPSGTFPDQIWPDSTGLIWFSQPPNNQVTSFDPKTNKFTQYPTTGGRGPDGLWVDDQDRVWTGLYYSSHLGFLDVPTKKFTSIAPPYSPANLAIPSPSSRGTVWVTDHAKNRISEYDPVQKKWVGTFIMPINRTWVVAGTLDPTRETVYFTGYSSHTLPFKQLNGPIGNIPVPSRGGPAFLTYHDNKVWFSLWLSNRLGEYDVVTQRITEYTYRGGEVGGPMYITPSGKPVVGTRSRGYIVVFDPVTKTFTEHKIPTSTGLKDGLTVAPDGAIWFTGTSRNKIARLVLK